MSAVQVTGTPYVPFDEAALVAMRQEVHAVNETNGWFESDRSFEDGIVLIHSEISEMLEAYRRWGLEDATGRDCPCSPDSMKVSPAHLCKPEGVGSEAADVLIRLLDEAYRQQVPLRQRSVWTEPLDAPFGTHLARLHLITSILYLSRVIENGLTRIHTDLVRFCAKFDIDLNVEYERKIAYNRTRGHRHGGKRL